MSLNIKYENNQHLKKEEPMFKEFYQENFNSQMPLPFPLEECEFEQCQFVGVDFKNLNLSHARFIDCHFENCDLSNGQLNNTKFLSPLFSHCKMIGIDWNQSNDLINPQFIECILNYSSFAGMKLKKMSFKGSQLHDVDFTQADLSESNLDETDLLNTRFNSSILVKSSFVGAINYHINPLSNKIKGAKFSLPEAIGLLADFDVIIK